METRKYYNAASAVAVVNQVHDMRQESMEEVYILRKSIEQRIAKLSKKLDYRYYQFKEGQLADAARAHESDPEGFDITVSDININHRSAIKEILRAKEDIAHLDKELEVINAYIPEMERYEGK